MLLNSLLPGLFDYLLLILCRKHIAIGPTRSAVHGRQLDAHVCGEPGVPFRFLEVSFYSRGFRPKVVAGRAIHCTFTLRSRHFGLFGERRIR